MGASSSSRRHCDGHRLSVSGYSRHCCSKGTWPGGHLRCCHNAPQQRAWQGMAMTHCLLRMVTTPIKNFLSCAKTSLSSFLSSHSPSPACMLPCHMSLNCHDTTSGCMTINCPLPHLVIPEYPSRAYGPRDCLTIRMDDMTNRASLQTSPDLDPLSSMDSTQTHDSPVTPESPPYLPSPHDSLVEGEEPSTQVGTNDSLAYDSLVTALSRLSPEPLSDPHRIIR